MSKKEIIGYFPPQPVPTPQQLDNSINALSEFSISDERINRYKAMRDRAVQNMDEWNSTVKQVKAAFKK